MTDQPNLETEEFLRDAFDAIAEGVREPDDAYHRVRAEWRRRERRRRLRLIVAIAIVLTIADGVALWALNRTQPQSGVVFDGPNLISVPPPSTPDVAKSPDPLPTIGGPTATSRCDRSAEPGSRGTHPQCAREDRRRGAGTG